MKRILIAVLLIAPAATAWAGWKEGVATYHHGDYATAQAVLPGDAVALGAEEVFRGAARYTVKIRTRITTAFVEESKGTRFGAGFVVDAERGWIMTNAHVAGRSPATISVAFKGKPYVEARKVYVDQFLDLAILQVDRAKLGVDLATAPLACRKVVSVGHPVGAYGHPWGLEFSGTRGIISGEAKDRAGLVQMDAAINPGNSGGPLISLTTRRVVGINTSRMSDEKDQNTNFAVPMKFACRVLEILRAGENPSPPRLSVMFFHPPIDRSALIVARSYLPSDQLPLMPGDEIVSANGDQIVNEAQLIHAIRGRLGDIKLTLRREGKERTIRGRLEPQPLITERVGVLVSGLLIGPRVYRDGAVLNADNGFVIHDVEPGSVGESLGFKAWDVVAIDGKRHVDIHKVYEYFAKKKRDTEKFVITIVRFSQEHNQWISYMKRKLDFDGLSLISARLR